MEQDLFVYGNSAWVTYKFLTERNVPLQTIYNKASKNGKNRLHIRSHPNNRKLKLVEYDSIPTAAVEKFNLPSFAELVAIAETQNKLIKDSYKNKAYIILKNLLEFEYSQWESIRPIYCNLLMNEEKIESYCKTHILFSKIIELNNKKDGFKLKDLFNAYSLFDGLVFETNSPRSFMNKVNEIKKANSIEEGLMHGLRNKISNNCKITEEVEWEIKALLANPKKFSAEMITLKVNDYLVKTNREKISKSTVEAFIARQSIKNEVAISRYGLKYAKEKMIPHAHFIPPHKEGLLWLVDGTRFQFPYKGGPDRYNFLTYYLVIDGFDKKIIGYSFDDCENTEMVIAALEQACRTKNYLPTEIISDNSPAYRAKEYLHIISIAHKMGVNWRINRTKNPRDNSYVERCFGVIQSMYCKKYDGYMGDGIKSKDPNGQPSPEEKTKYIQNKYLRTRDEVIDLINKIVVEYNDSMDRKVLMKKDEYDLKLYGKRNINPIKLDSQSYAKLFWASVDLKVQDGMISFVLNKRTYRYNIYDIKITTEYVGVKIRVRFNRSDMSRVMLFNLGSDSYICTLELYTDTPKSSSERNKEQNRQLYTHIHKANKLEKALKQHIKQIKEKSKENWEKIPPEIAEFAPVSKPLREKSEKKIVDKELDKLSEDEKLRVIRLKDKPKDNDTTIRNSFKSKGSLKKL